MLAPNQRRLKLALAFGVHFAMRVAATVVLVRDVVLAMVTAASDTMVAVLGIAHVFVVFVVTGAFVVLGGRGGAGCSRVSAALAR